MYKEEKAIQRKSIIFSEIFIRSFSFLKMKFAVLVRFNIENLDNKNLNKCCKYFVQQGTYSYILFF